MRSFPITSKTAIRGYMNHISLLEETYQQKPFGGEHRLHHTSVTLRNKFTYAPSTFTGMQLYLHLMHCTRTGIGTATLQL
jgi:hypothetical protein